MSDPRWARLARDLPDWFRRARLGILVHWGPYAVPAWAENTGELTDVPEQLWFKHNPHAQWYANSIRIPGPARQHHQDTYHGAPYDTFLDLWQAQAFDPTALLTSFAAAGASYLVLTTKHHDGFPLWDAPGTAPHNTVHRGPHTDLVASFATAARAAGLRFGAYYSGGFDWRLRPGPAIDDRSVMRQAVLQDAEYARYAATHVRDLIGRYTPDILWNDIDWPQAGKDFGPHGIGTVIAEYYQAVSDGVINDRFALPHFDFATSELAQDRAHQTHAHWEHCRGIGLSLAYNGNEDTRHALDGPATARMLADICCRGGRLLLGVGPKADGTLPEWQAKVLSELGRWTRAVAEVLPVVGRTSIWAQTTNDQTRCWTGSHPDGIVVFVDADGNRPAELSVSVPGYHPDRAILTTCGWAEIAGRADGVQLLLSAARPGPAVVIFRR